MHKHIYVTHLHLCNIIIHKLIYAIYIYDIAFMLKHIYEIFLIHIWDIFMKMYVIHFLWYMYYIFKNIVMGSKHKSKKVIGIVFFLELSIVTTLKIEDDLLLQLCLDFESWRMSTNTFFFFFIVFAWYDSCRKGLEIALPNTWRFLSKTPTIPPEPEVSSRNDS